MIAHYLAICGPKRWPPYIGAAVLKQLPHFQELLVAVGKAALSNSGDARRLAELVKSYTEYLGIPLDPLSQRMIDTQLRNSS